MSKSDEPVTGSVSSASPAGRYWRYFRRYAFGSVTWTYRALMFFAVVGLISFVSDMSEADTGLVAGLILFATWWIGRAIGRRTPPIHIVTAKTVYAKSGAILSVPAKPIHDLIERIVAQERRREDRKEQSEEQQ